MYVWLDLIYPTVHVWLHVAAATSSQTCSLSAVVPITVTPQSARRISLPNLDIDGKLLL